MSACDQEEGRPKTDPKFYSCAQCNEKVPSASEMIKHMKEKHGIELCKEIKTDTKTEPFIIGLGGISWNMHWNMQNAHNESAKTDNGQFSFVFSDISFVNEKV